MFDFKQTPQQYMDLSKELGAKYVVTSFNPPPSVAATFSGPNPDMGAIMKALEGMTLDDYKRGAETANKLGEEAKKRDLVYAYHNHNLEFKKADGKTIFETIIDSTDPNTVKPKWIADGFLRLAMIRSVLKKYPERIRLLHIKAFKAGPASTSLGGPESPPRRS